MITWKNLAFLSADDVGMADSEIEQIFLFYMIKLKRSRNYDEVTTQVLTRS